MIKAIFYSKFDTIEGPKVVHQVPDGAIVPSPTAPSQLPFLTFSDVSFFVIPRQELCGNLLQVCTNGYRILGYPICMKSVRYDRNEFIFNFCIVLAEEDDFSTYKSVAQKLADLMHGLEEQNGFLSRDFSKSGEGKVYSLCEMLMEDLNNYCECMIPIDELNTLNIKLFPIYPSPPPVKAWQVPLFTLRYQAFMDENWDLTMQRIVPHINGVNSVRIISILADTDFSLTCRALRHLLYYGCLFILDIFSFSAIYAPTAQFSATIGLDEAMQLECARYVNLRFAPHPPTGPSSPLPPTLIPPPSANGSTNSSTRTAVLSSSLTDPTPSLVREESRFDAEEIWPLLGTEETHPSTSPTPTNGLHKPAVVDGVALVELYASLKQGQSVKQWYAAHSRYLANIDIRRFITFGVIKGFLYRVHKYACATSQPAPPPRASSFTPTALSPRATTGTNTPYAVSSVSEDANNPAVAKRESSRERAVSVFSGSRSGNGNGSGGAPSAFWEEEEEVVGDEVLGKYLDVIDTLPRISLALMGLNVYMRYYGYDRKFEDWRIWFI
ncbi:Nitrogen permease regulator Npr2, putative [Penicillium digitatum]|uniref:Nitrogen permease regulator Npr2, putative n=3 Tax=Penicillium digitatum TaxID=36651 RepID=K9GDG5_PEND2|nr:Nitrogen permease regulator Npr2, putative [Penicillium digitatum Pd1]EKV11306.1 Nitrogen permease regulator Npr2, putative [Penicillium digitatum PHI26]EKV20037.1 Nitrogen permease regulator Npr2, putative [Penicillium digitatum Pd1]QQK39642.1 Nitrogen permease regulator Npr2, putative [Penicillium digitatum]